MRSLEELNQVGIITALEYSVAQSMHRRDPTAKSEALLAFALAQAALRFGHLALRLESVLDDFSPEIIKAYIERRLIELPESEHEAIPPILESSDLPSLNEWIEAISQSTVVWQVGTPHRQTPFILDGSQLFVYKSWVGEGEVASYLRVLNQRIHPVPFPSLLWSRLFEATGTKESPKSGWFEGQVCWDRSTLALYTGLTRGVLILQGGPGTGKTTLTQRVLASLIEQYETPEEPLRIALTAPTGKAAQRMTESLHTQASFFHLPDILQQRLCELKGQTLHALLGVAPGRERPEYHEENPLPYDVIVVDEASMVDLWLMRSLVRALDSSPQRAHRQRLLLIGDPCQLPSVSAGAPFSELCNHRGKQLSAFMVESLASFLTKSDLPQPILPLNSMPLDMTKSIEESTIYDPNIQRSTSLLPPYLTAKERTDLHPSLSAEASTIVDQLELQIRVTQHADFADSVVALTEVKRVSSDSGIHRAASLMQSTALNASTLVIESLNDPLFKDTALFESETFPQALFHRVHTHYRTVVQLAYSDPLRALDEMKALCLLSPHYGGPLGVHYLNDLIEAELRRTRTGGWGRRYVGRPVLITQNHPTSGLVNGDIGIIGQNELVYFESLPQPIEFQYLPPHRTVFAMSVHKSQGSEFKLVIFCLPPERSPILTRELIYTGLTRAKQEAIIVGSSKVLKESIDRYIERGGQLSNRLDRTNSYNKL